MTSIVYVITPADETTGHMKVTSFASAEQAQSAATKSDYVVRDAGDILWTGNTLVEVFNAVTGKHLKKFESREIGARRLMEALPGVAKQKEVDMAREYKIGEFKQVRKNSHLGKVLDEGLSDPNPTLTTISEATGLNREKVRSILAAGRRTHGIDHEIDKDSGLVTIKLPADVTNETVFVAQKEKVADEKVPRKYKVGEFRPVRRSSGLGELVAAALEGGTADTIGAALGQSSEEVINSLKSLRRTHGFDYKVENDQVHLIVPDDTDPFIATKEQTPRPEGAPRRSKNSDLDAKAAAGEMPEKPTINSPTNIHRQKHFDKLASLAEEGDWDAVKAYHIKGIDSYSAMINRYRDRLLAAHEALNNRVAAE